MNKKIILYLIVLFTVFNLVKGLGVAPAKIDVFYEPLAENQISFRIINNEYKEMDVALIVKGELSDYITIEQQKVHISSNEFEKVVTYKINFPLKLKPGKHITDIMVVETSESKPNENIVVANIGVIHTLTVQAPYPDQYLEGILYISDIKPNEKATFTLSLANVGSKDIDNIKGQIIITGPEKEGVAKIITNELSLKEKEKGKVTGDWTAAVAPGSYHAQALVEYDSGKILVIEKDFDIGEPLLEISDLRVGPFKLGTIAKFDILLKNKWNNVIENIFGTTEIRDSNGALVDTYKTSLIDIPATGSKEITSYWDTKDISPGKFSIGIKANYLGRTKEKTYEMEVKEDEIVINSQLTGQAIGNNGFKTGKSNLIGIVIGLIFALILVKLVLDFVAKTKVKKQIKEEDHPELRGYIISKMKEGYSREVIKENLMSKGWSEKLIEREMLKAEDELGK